MGLGNVSADRNTEPVRAEERVAGLPGPERGDPNPARQEAAANVRKMLAEKDRREAAASAKKTR